MSVELDKMYEDTMDDNRFVMPVKQEGTKLLCKVYWGQGEKKDYGGMVSLSSASFFASSPTDHKDNDWKARQAKQFVERTGFRLAGTGPKREPAGKPERKQERGRSNDDEGPNEYRSRSSR